MDTFESVLNIVTIVLPAAYLVFIVCIGLRGEWGWTRTGGPLSFEDPSHDRRRSRPQADLGTGTEPFAGFEHLRRRDDIVRAERIRKAFERGIEPGV